MMSAKTGIYITYLKISFTIPIYSPALEVTYNSSCKYIICLHHNQLFLSQDLQLMGSQMTANLTSHMSEDRCEQSYSQDRKMVSTTIP